MWIDNDHAAEMYARFAKARYGQQKAALIAERNAADLQRKGDAEGERVWKKVKLFSRKRSTDRPLDRQ